MRSREKPRRGSSPSTRPSRRYRVAARRRAPRARDAGRVGEHEADVPMLPESGHQSRVPGSGSPRASGDAAPPSGRSGRGCPSRARRRPVVDAFRTLASSRASVAGLVEREPDRRLVLVAAEERLHRPLDRTSNELVERVPVALLERRALGLPVVGEDDDLVRARSVSSAARAIRPSCLSTLRSVSRVSCRSRPEWCATSS